MPSAVADGDRPVPEDLWPLVHDLLVSSGFEKAAKALRKKVDVEVHRDKKRKKSSEADENGSTNGKDSKKSKKSKKVSSDVESEDEPQVNNKKSKKAKKAASDVESEDEEETQEKKIKVKAANGATTASPKAAVNDDGATAVGSSTPASSAKNRDTNSSPFQRVKAEEVTYLKVRGGKSEEERLKDNTFESKGGDVFGAKASEILSAVRGKDFRHEKTKKKRSFRSSGPIDMNSNSIKFESDGDD